MKKVEELQAQCLAILPVEVRDAKKDHFEWLNKKTGKAETIDIIRVGLELDTPENHCQIDGKIGGFDKGGAWAVKDIPSWCRRGARVIIGCKEFGFDKGKPSVTIVDAVEVGK